MNVDCGECPYVTSGCKDVCAKAGLKSAGGPQPTAVGLDVPRPAPSGGAPRGALPFTRPVLVGEQNQLDADRKFDLYPLPEHSAGGRLCRKILGMRLKDYMHSFDRVNLLGSGKWNPREAAARAAALKRTQPMGARFILLGAKVCEAFGFPDLKDFCAYADQYAGFDGPVTVASYLRLPHPSGRCRVWNDPVAYARAREAVRQFVPEPVARLVGRGDL